MPPHAVPLPLRTLNLYLILADGYDKDMKTLKFFISLTFLILSSYGYSEEISKLIKQFDYDSNAALDFQQAKVEERNGILIKDITYASPKGGRVGAYLIMPPGKGADLPDWCLDIGVWEQDQNLYLKLFCTLKRALFLFFRIIPGHAQLNGTKMLMTLNILKVIVILTFKRSLNCAGPLIFCKACLMWIQMYWLCWA